MSSIHGYSSSSTGRCQKLPPLCGCQLPMVMYKSKKTESYGKRFWRCQNWSKGKGYTCDMFDWEDDVVPEAAIDERKKVVVDCATCKTVAEIVNQIEVKKNAKLKSKIVKERKKVKLVTLLLIFSWFFFVWYVKN
ncbi:hypothetical protein P8452_22664 [Trifolium repens]|nr:hypothetical protein P8452_22664 [Trifolium repens]